MQQSDQVLLVDDLHARTDLPAEFFQKLRKHWRRNYFSCFQSASASLMWHIKKLLKNLCHKIASLLLLVF